MTREPRPRWVDAVAVQIARDPRCCDVSSSDAAAIAEWIREAVDREVKEALARYRSKGSAGKES